MHLNYLIVSAVQLSIKTNNSITNSVTNSINNSKSDPENPQMRSHAGHDRITARDDFSYAEYMCLLVKSCTQQF